MYRVAALLTLVPGAAIAGPMLNVSGTCPGTNTIVVERATPGAQLAFVTASGLSRFTTVPSGSCAGTLLDLSNGGLTLRALPTANPQGVVFLNAALPEGVCGEWLQVVDLSSCETSNVAMLAENQVVYRDQYIDHQYFDVPAGVTTLEVVVNGAQGGDGEGTGGLGGSARGPLTVYSGSTLELVVGNRGDTDTVSALGGYPDGGTAFSDGVVAVGSGGGSSDIRTFEGGTADRMIVGAGGGGGGWGGHLSDGGDGGGLVGEAGSTGDPVGAPAGGAGSQTAGGWGPGYAETGIFGRGGVCYRDGIRGCGAGGGGWYGGGGGLASGGGGGSSYVPPVSYGARTFTGVEAADGEIVIRW